MPYCEECGNWSEETQKYFCFTCLDNKGIMLWDEWEKRGYIWTKRRRKAKRKQRKKIRIKKNDLFNKYKYINYLQWYVVEKLL